MKNAATCCSSLGASNKLVDTAERKEGLHHRWPDFCAPWPTLKTDNLSRSTAVHNVLTLSNPIFLPTVYSPALIYLSLPFSYKHNRANTMFTSKHMACWETVRVQHALSVGQSRYYMRKSVGQAPTAERARQKLFGRLPTSERNRKIIMLDEVRRRIGKG
jgi:hypothetical protein